MTGAEAMFETRAGFGRALPYVEKESECPLNAVSGGLRKLAHLRLFQSAYIENSNLIREGNGFF